MNETECRHRINQLQNQRHTLLKEREQPNAAVIVIDMKLNVVRSELLALYTVRPVPKS